MLVLLSGVSGAGKDTIKKELLKRMDNATTMPSYTDREHVKAKLMEKYITS